MALGIGCKAVDDIHISLFKKVTLCYMLSVNIYPSYILSGNIYSSYTLTVNICIRSTSARKAKVKVAMQ